MAALLGAGTDPFVDRLTAAVTVLVKAHAAEATGIMRAAAPWVDRTGHARAGLVGEVEVRRGFKGGVTVVLVLRHSMEYGVWLETHKGPAYGSRSGMPLSELARPDYAGPLAVVHPTADQVGPALRSDLRELLRKGP